MTQEYVKISDQKNPFRILATVLSLSTLAIILSLLTIYSASEKREQQQQILLDIQSMRGNILYNKGLMDKAIFMSAFTADTKWKMEYDVYHQAMLDSFEKLHDVAPGVLDEVAGNLTSANEKILNIHKEAFLLIDANFKQEAMFMLVDSEYETYEKLLKDTLQEVDVKLEDLVKTEQKSGRRALLNRLILTTGFIGVVFISWFISWVILNRWRKAIKIAEKEREWMLEELEISTRALEESHSENQAIIQYAADGIITLNKQGIIISYNKSAKKILNTFESELIDKKIEDIIPNIQCVSDNNEKLFNLSEYFKKIGTERVELSMFCKETLSDIPLEITISKIEIGENNRYTALIRDVSSKKEAEEATRQMDIAQRKNEAKSQFLANMSHELRTPMNGIIGMTDLILRTDLSEKQEDFALIIKKSANSLHNVINDILDFSKIEEGALQLELIPFNLHQTIDDVADVFASSAESKGLGLMVHYLPGTIENVIADPGRICQILNNLINNAIKFTYSGHIIVTINEKERLDNGKVVIKFSVQDTGIGISEERKNEVFKRFTQADETTTRKFGGTGLGLTISKEISHLMGGDIGVDSKEGEGSIFWFTIPVDNSEEIEENKFLNVLPEISLKGKNVLVIEDNYINSKIIKEHLTYFDMNCTLVGTAEKAKELLAQHYADDKVFDIAIVDYKLPGINGLDFGKNLQDDPVYKEIPLIAFTSVVENDTFQEFENAGFSGYLTKPMKTDVLKNMIAFILFKNGDIKNIVTRHSLINKKNNAPKKLQNEYHILVVEDDKVNQKVAKNLLQGLGCKVSLADNGIISLDMLSDKNDFDLIFMDMQMPELDGISTTNRIRQIEKENNTKPIYIIALTANANKEDRERCLQAGMNDFLSKPITIEVCEQAVLNWEAKHLSNSNNFNTSKYAKIDGFDIEKNGNLKEIVVDIKHFELITLNDKGLQLEIAQDYLDNAKIAIDTLSHSEIGSNAWVEITHKLKGSSLNVGANALADICAKSERDFKNYTKEELMSLMKENYESVQKNFKKLINSQKK